MLQVWQINLRYVDGIFPLKAEQNSIETSLCGRVFTLLPTWLGRFLGSDLQLILRLVTGGFAWKVFPPWERCVPLCSVAFCRVALVRVHFKVAAHCGLH